ncbi:AsmA family protein [Actimicrobium sp. CCI2.3]|uniref:AsmA family protein n=1 Tax=Actimicrobium sp. CCI2.3 TaxID=3048616 RepID=UPI002AB53697|nr:AsmA family protein [Actimicrobium sp. CCI2.3]MDY7573169.1 AsmA family protein [Actimicrobium sp. CCI2.3]MEB0022148.1 AsmA family protein [Actimicrobium sp. CCI2.3]
MRLPGISADIPRYAVICALLVLLVLGGWTFASQVVFDQSRWIHWLEQRATVALGRTVHIGALSVHALPLPGIDVYRVQVANPAGAQAAMLLQAEQVSIQLALWPLLIGQVQLSALTVQGAHLELEQSHAGAASWSAASLDLDQLTAVEVRQSSVRYRRPQFDSGITHITNLSVHSKPGWREIEVEALLRRETRELIASARLDELSVLPSGSITLSTGSARVTMAGRLPLQAVLTNAAVKLQIDAQRPTDLLAFIHSDADLRTIAPFSLHADLREAGGKLSASAIDARLGNLHVTGTAQLDPGGSRPTVNAQLSAPRLDWVELLADAGRTPFPPKPAGELFRKQPFAWRALAAMQGMQGSVALRIGSVRTRPGIELTDVSSNLLIDGDRLQLSEFKAGLLGGKASGDLKLTATGKQAHMVLHLEDVSLQKWLVATSGSAPLTGGQMQIDARVDAHGDNMKEMAASLTGPVRIRLGPATITSRSGATAEALLTGLMPILSTRNADGIALECAAAKLAFVDGRAVASPLVGVRSQASQLLTSGIVDLREETLDLSGRVRARSGIALGLATLSGDVRIAGSLVNPLVRLDPTGSPSALLRLGAAIATGGLSIVGTALWDGANPGTDPCQAVLRDAVHRTDHAAS